MISQLLQNLPFITPELVMTATICLMVLAFLIMRKNSDIAMIVGLIGLLGTLLTLLQSFGDSESLFAGMLVVDPFSQFFKILIVSAAIVVLLMSKFSDEVNQVKESIGEFYFLITSMTLGMMLMVSSSNLLMMYLTLELTSMTSYIAVGFTKKAKDSAEASLKYLLYGAFSSGVMLYGISILYGLTGTLSITGVNQVLAQGSTDSYMLIITGLFLLVGFGYKISAVPFHYWTPDVYEGAPITITAFLSVASKAAGFAMMMRALKVLFFNSLDVNLEAGTWSFIKGLPMQELLIILSVLTMTVGNLVALWQDNVKRLLAFSSIAQAGYMLLGLAVMSNEGYSAVMIYFVVYLFMNLGAFYVAMLIYNTLKSEHIDDYKGFGRRAPFLAVSMAIFLVSLTGLPPTAGFIGKWMIFLALINAKMILVAVIGVLNSVVSLYYYVRIIRNMFLREGKEDSSLLKFSLPQQLIIVLLVVPTLYYGLFFNRLIEVAQFSVSMFGMK
jgi:NADH-quinone oxidoreductase subunit N